jgi:hypothetical protein
MHARIMRHPYIGIALAALAVFGVVIASIAICGRIASGSPPPGSTTPPPDAITVIQQFRAAGLPLGDTDIVYTAATDPNHLLGRPNGYLSKVSFIDGRINSTDVRDASPGSVDLGGSVEVFATQSDALARVEYITRIEKDMPLFGTEHDYVTGSVLIRVSSLLSPGQATEYLKAAAG